MGDELLVVRDAERSPCAIDGEGCAVAAIVIMPRINMVTTSESQGSVSCKFINANSQDCRQALSQLFYG
jgi:hypothetical protein